MVTPYQIEPFQISNLLVWALNPIIPVLGSDGLPKLFQVAIRVLPNRTDNPFPMFKYLGEFLWMIGSESDLK